MNVDGADLAGFEILKLPASIRVQLEERAATTPWVGNPEGAWLDADNGNNANNLMGLSASTACQYSFQQLRPLSPKG